MNPYLLMKLWASESSVREALDTSFPRIIPERRWFGNRIIGTGYRLQDTGDRGQRPDTKTPQPNPMNPSMGRRKLENTKRGYRTLISFEGY